MAGGAETPNIAALPAILQLGACESARGIAAPPPIIGEANSRPSARKLVAAAAPSTDEGGSPAGHECHCVNLVMGLFGHRSIEALRDER
jgi:hypothetical protein